MTYAPQTIVDAAKVWTAHGGLNAGIVGSFRTHCKGYHLGRDRIYSQCACKPNGHKCSPGQYGNDYSVSLARDRAGLTDAAMAFDAGPINDSLPRLRSFTAWLIRECRSDTADTQDIREIIGSVDGVHVINWLRDRGTDSQPEAGGDSTHLHHTHISYYRDTEHRDKSALFRRYFGGTPPPDTGTDEDVDVTITAVKGEDWTPDQTRRPYRDAPVRSGTTHIKGYIELGATVRTIAEASTPDGNIWRLTEIGGKPAWLLRSDFTPLVQGGDPVVDAGLTKYISRA